MQLYGIFDTRNGKLIYIGITAKTLKQRFRRHVEYARMKAPRQKLHRTMKKYGEGNFKPLTLANAGSWEELVQMEINAITHYGTFISEGGCNLTRGGEGRLGGFMTDEGRARISRANRGRKHSPESVENMRQAQQARMDGKRGMKGKHHTEEAKRILSEKNRGANHPQFGLHRSEETKRKLSEKNTGKTINAEQRRSLSVALKGKPKSAEHNRKVSEAKRGKPLSEFHKQRLREGQRRRWHPEAVAA